MPSSAITLGGALTEGKESPSIVEKISDIYDGHRHSRAGRRTAADAELAQHQEPLMTAVMQGIRILEVAEHTFVPAASAVLSDWGAEVIKIEHVERGDAMRGLAASGVVS